MSAPNIDQAMLPSEAAKFLGISEQKLGRLRRKGKIEGHQVGKTNLFTYTMADLRNANLQPEKRGPKPKKHSTNVDQN